MKDFSSASRGNEDLGYEIQHKISRYYKYARDVYAKFTELNLTRQGAFSLASVQGFEDAPAALTVRFYSSPAVSCIKNVQLFLYVTVGSLQLPRTAGGVRNAVQAMFDGDVISDEDMVLIMKDHLRDTANANQIICIVPKEQYQKASPTGRYMFISDDVLWELRNNRIPHDFYVRLVKLFGDKVHEPNTPDEVVIDQPIDYYCNKCKDFFEAIPTSYGAGICPICGREAWL